LNRGFFIIIYYFYYGLLSLIVTLFS